MLHITCDYKAILLPILVLFGIHRHNGDALELTLLNTKLPYSLNYASVVYDGEDSIYLFGGNLPETDVRTMDILKLSSLSSPSPIMEVVGSIPNGGIGSTHLDSDGNIRFFNGSPDPSEVYQFNPKTNETLQLTTLPHSTMAAVEHNDTSLYIIRGALARSQLYSFDLRTPAYKYIFTLPCQIIMYPSSVRVDRKAYYFGSRACNDPYPHDKSVFILDLDTLKVEVGPENLPAGNPTVVFDQKDMYLFGGKQLHANGITKLNPKTLDVEFISIDSYPVQGDSYFRPPPSVVYVPKFDRIYGFGGTSYNLTIPATTPKYHDEIWYIDLSSEEATTVPTTEMPTTTTLNPEVFTCDDADDGHYPHPYDCSKFIICYEGSTLVYSCPPPLLFDPVQKGCDYSDRVNCTLSCADKADGRYPHPHDCSLFIICRDGLLDVFKCPPPLLFDPKVSNCNLPQLVSCQLMD